MTYSFLLFLVVILVLLNVFVFKNKSVRTKILYTIGIIAGGLLLLLVTIVILWHTSNGSREPLPEPGDTTDKR
jgi:peptidoglycan biosynthesis protein MviN/MurJ (putative lipid II flippase)